MAILKSRRWPQAFSSLASHDFRWFTVSQLASTTANWMEVIVRSLIIYNLSGSAVVIGAVNVSRTFPSLVCGFIGGVLADRWDRRTLLTASQLAHGCSAAALGFLVLTDSIRIWHFVVAAIIEGIMGSLQQPARQALIPAVVPREHLMNAIALSGGIWNASRTIGPTLAGGAAAVAGPSAALFLEAALYFGAAVATRRISPMTRSPGTSPHEGSSHRPRSGEKRKNDFLEDFRGYRYLWENRIVGWLAILAIVPVLFAAGHRILAPVFAKEVLDMGAGGVGLLLAAPGIGAIAAVFIVAVSGTVHHKGLLSLAGVMVHGLAIVVYALSDRLWISLTALIVHGFAMTAYRSLNQTLIQLNTPDEYMGRVMAVHAADRSLHPLTGLAVALLADLWGVQAAVAASGAGCAIVALIVAFKSRVIRHLD